jgi:hypothetical protein
MKKFLVEICLSICMVFLPWGLALAISLSPTTITIFQAVHFLTPDGTDVIVNPGNYDVEAAGNVLRLQSSNNTVPIHIQAGPTPFPDEVESPVAMAIPMPEGGIYLALAVPEGTGLEAMGFYSGIHARGAGVLQSRKPLSEQQRSRLKAFAGQLRKNPNAPDLQSQWKELTRKGQGQTSSISQSDINAFIQYVLRESYLETTKDLQYFASKVKFFNEQKKQVREHIQKTRRKQAQAPEAKNKEASEKLKEKLEQELKDLEAQERLANFEIQRLMSQYNQAEQTASSILKKKREVDSNVIRKIN